MENSNSGDSSPLSREIDCEIPPMWDIDPPPKPSHKLKLMCSYGGRIQPRSHDHQLSYVGGDTKILAVDRSATFAAVISKLAALSEIPSGEICLKYQLPGEDLDALISVTNDEDLEYMMLEYDRLSRSSLKPARLRIFLFMANSKAIESKEVVTDENSKWFVDALNSVKFCGVGGDSSPMPVPDLLNPDFLFGFDKVAGGEPVASVESQIEKIRIVDSEMRKLYEEASPNSNSAVVLQRASPAPPVQLPVPADYWPEIQVAGGIPADQQPVYVIQPPTGAIYQNSSMQPAAGQPFYSLPRVQPAPPVIQQAHRQSQFPEHGYAQVYYTLAAPSYQTVSTAGGGVGTEIPPQTTSSPV